jgi:hypothetical protein
VIAGLQKNDPVCSDQINHAVLLCQPPGPYPWSKVFQGLWFALAFEGIPQHILDQGKNPKGHLPVFFNPPAHIFSELWVEYGV